jgi:hypothetical protein
VFFDRCFNGMRAHRGSFQLATKMGAGGGTGIRIALETGRRLGTSGTVPWLPIRFALATASERLCITDEAALEAAYRRTTHNCRDVLDLLAGARRYEVQFPDTRLSGPARTVAILSVYAGSTLIQGPTSLTTTTCATQLPALPCTSGGPCD